MMLFHLSIRRFPYLAPQYLNTTQYIRRYQECGGDTSQTNDPNNICDTLFVSLDWTTYKAKDLLAFSDSKARGYNEGYFVIDGGFYNIE